MKFFTLTMGFYLLLLSVLPCNDCNDFDLGQQAKISASSNQSHQQEAETCSPLCTCSCCAISAVTASIFTFQMLQPSLQQINFYSKPNLYQFDFHSFWQPPKIA